MDADFNNIKKGTLLLAEPFMQDEHFKRSVVLICEHNTEGTIGLILNKPTIFKVNQMVGNFPHINAFIHSGGPVENDRLNYIHVYHDIIPNAFQIEDNIYWNGDFDVLKEQIKLKHIMPQNIMFFSGYAAWDFEQLKAEVEEQSWIICNIDYPIFKTSEYMWKDILQKMGGKYKLIAEYPENPNLN
ncbi:MAG: YqgE/AlgH family protein [Sphingobacteriales bacterium]|jgi:putative transcriptional regulator|nr:MAG: YqgE/AlgH family protein [Sphingobacteriales bacterium]